MTKKATDGPNSSPTWYSDIRHFFNATDIAHMRAQGLELGTYDSVKENSSSIYAQLSAKQMPPGRPWSDDRVQTFLNWIINKYPMGTKPTSLTGKTLLEKSGAVASRIRKEVRELSQSEIDKLTSAFNGILSMDITDPNSYFIQAGYHWFPGPNLYCQHHVNNYNPWHRAYLFSFENALRSVPGCEDVTLPYWDYQNLTDFPALFKRQPFRSYTLPENVSSNYKKGYTTQRNSASQILRGFKTDVTPQIEFAIAQNTWELFNGFNDQGFHGIIGAHDAGHWMTGPTMKNQGVAAFDPIFWFFHANWDRLWWKWQQDMHATDLNGFLSTVTDKGNLAFFTVDALETIPPFSQKTTDTIDLIGNFDTNYKHPSTVATMSEKVMRSLGSVPAESNFHSIQIERLCELMASIV